MKKQYKILLYIILATFTVMAFCMQLGTSQLPTDMLEKVPNNFFVKGFLHLKYSINSFDIYIIIFLGVLFTVYRKAFDKVDKTNFSILLFSYLISWTLLLCESFYRTNSWNMLFESGSAILVALIKSIGYTPLIFAAVNYLFSRKIALVDTYEMMVSRRNKFHRIIIFTLIIMVSWLPYIILLFPGCFSPDAQDEIAQLYNNRDYCWSIKGMVLLDENVILNNHHPVFYTQILRVVLWFGRLIHSYEWAFELFCILQCIFLALIFAYSLSVMCENGVKKWYRNVAMIFFAFNPVIPIYGMTIVKDTLFMGTFMLVIVLLYEIIICDKWESKRLIITSFVFLVLMLLRNNGLYILCLLGLFAILVFWKNRLALKRLLFIIIIPVLIFQIGITGILYPALNISSGSIREVLSIPFQQTARFVSEYPDEISEEDAAVICTILNSDGTIEEIAERYIPDRADDVKNHFNRYSTGKDLINYFKVWIKELFQHPLCYIEAFLNMNYGWVSFYSNQDHSTYARTGGLSISKLINGFDNPGGNAKIRNMIYEIVRTIERIPLCSWAVEFSFYTWGYIFLLIYMIWKKKKKELLICGVIYANYLICFLGPVAYLRYALPMVICFPFVIFMIYSERMYIK